MRPWWTVCMASTPSLKPSTAGLTIPSSLILSGVIAWPRRRARLPLHGTAITGNQKTQMLWMLTNDKTVLPLPNLPQQNKRSASKMGGVSPVGRKDIAPPLAPRRKPGIIGLGLLGGKLEWSKRNLMAKDRHPLPTSGLNTPPMILKQAHPLEPLQSLL